MDWPRRCPCVGIRRLPVMHCCLVTSRRQWLVCHVYGITLYTSLTQNTRYFSAVLAQHSKIKLFYVWNKISSKLDSLRWFSQRRSRTPYSWGWAPRGAMTPKFELSQDFCTTHLHLPASFIIICLLVLELSCWQTNKQTDAAKTSNALRDATTTLGNYFGLRRRPSEIIVLRRARKLAGNYFKFISGGSLQLANIFQHVQCRWYNYFEVISELFRRMKFQF